MAIVFIVIAAADPTQVAEGEDVHLEVTVVEEAGRLVFLHLLQVSFSFGQSDVWAH